MTPPRTTACGWLVFGNGEHVAVASDRLQEGRTPTEAMAGLEYEPDPRMFTPRITAAADLRSGQDAWSVPPVEAPLAGRRQTC